MTRFQLTPIGQLRYIRHNLGAMLLTGWLIVVVTVIVLGVPTAFYANWNRYTTKVACIDAGYPTYSWTFQTGGICSRTENSNTVMVKVDSL